MRITTLVVASVSVLGGAFASHQGKHGIFHQPRAIDLFLGDAGLESSSPALNTTQLVSRDLGVGMCDEHTPCTNKACCGPDGRCGYSPNQCGKGCRFNCDAKAQCGQYAPDGSQKCPLNVCCSEFGYCGSTDDFCKWKGCDTKWGGCGDPKRPSCGKGANSVGKRTVGYYESWSSTRNCQKVQPEDLNLNGFTHLNFAFSFFDPKSFQIAPMDSNSGSLYNRFTSLKSKSSHLETWISVGGWSFTDPGPTRTAFSDMASDPGNRKKFIDGLIQFMSTYGFDGVDLDWEYPVADDRGGKKEDMQNYVTLAKEMKDAFGGKYGISMTLPTSYWYLQGFDLVGIQESIDWFNLMAYDLHGVWDKESKFVGPYIAPHTNDTEIDLGLDLLWRAGVTADKVVMGQGWYGRSYTLKDPSCNKPNGVCEFTAGAKAGPCSAASGILDLQEINDIIKKNNLKPEYDEKANVKWITWDNDQWVSFDDDQTFKAKKDFANSRCLGGLMVWAMDQVDQTADNVLSPVPGVTPGQKQDAQKMGSDLNAGTTCYTSKCKEKCHKGFHEVAQMTGQPTDLNTNICPKDNNKKHTQQHESLCCPNGATMGQCAWRGWRGVGLSCNAGCEDGEVEIAKNTNHIDKNVDQTCTGGLQSYCCKGFAPPPPKKKKESIGDKIKHAFQHVGDDIKHGFEKFGDDIKNFAEGALLDVASKLVCRVIVPGVMGVAEVAEDAVPVAGEIADAAEIAAEPEIIAGCSKGMDKLVGKAKGKIKPQSPKEQPRAAPKPHSPVPQSPRPGKTAKPDAAKPTDRPSVTDKPKTTDPHASKITDRASSTQACKRQVGWDQKRTNTWESVECDKNGKGPKTTHRRIITTMTPTGQASHTTYTSTCTQAADQACLHYASVISNYPQFSVLPCPKQAMGGGEDGTRGDSPAVDRWDEQHSKDWLTGKEKCQRDEYPPAYLMTDEIQGASWDIPGSQRLRFLDRGDNSRGGKIWQGTCLESVINSYQTGNAKEKKKFEDIVKEVDRQTNNKKDADNKRKTPTGDIVWEYYASIEVDLWPEFAMEFWWGNKGEKDTWKKMPDGVSDWGIWENKCWPDDLATDDPGFALLLDDEWYKQKGNAGALKAAKNYNYQGEPPSKNKKQKTNGGGGSKLRRHESMEDVMAINQTEPLGNVGAPVVVRQAAIEVIKH